MLNFAFLPSDRESPGGICRFGLHFGRRVTKPSPDRGLKIDKICASEIKV